LWISSNAFHEIEIVEFGFDRADNLSKYLEGGDGVYISAIAGGIY
jgi:hypothetical protein